jgi:hypothetical protein
VSEAQDFIFSLMKDRFPAVAARVAQDPKARHLAEMLIKVMEVLLFSPVRYLRLLS